MATYALSADGSAVVRLASDVAAAASTLTTAMLTNGYSAITGTGGTLTVTTYEAAFSGGDGGAKFLALYDNGAALPAGETLEWVQVVTTNNPLGTAVSPYLDNAVNTSVPFYSYTAANTTPGLPPGQLDFYDFSTRPPANLSTVNPITWSATLYPVIVTSGSKVLTVENGETWGWTMTKAMVGTDTGTFVNPQPTSATVTGVGTNNFTWGDGDPSSLSFTGGSFNTMPGTSFKLGTITFYNGSNSNDADTVTFNVAMNFTNIPEKNFTLSTTFTLINTPNTSDPVASADIVSLGGYGYAFNVEEGDTASADIYATLSTGLTATGTSAAADGSDALNTNPTLDPNPNYTLTIVGLENPTGDGFVTTTPKYTLPPTNYVAAGAIALANAIIPNLEDSLSDNTLDPIAPNSSGGFSAPPGSQEAMDCIATGGGQYVVPASTAAVVLSDNTTATTLFAGGNSSGQDILSGQGGGNFVLSGGVTSIVAAGNNGVFIAGGTADVALDNGNNAVLLFGATATITDGSGNNVIGLGTDSAATPTTSTAMITATGNDAVVQTAGASTVDATAASAMFAGNGSGTMFLTGGPGTLTYIGGMGQATVVGGSGAMLAGAGAGGDNLLIGGSTQNVLFGGGSGDELVAGSGNATLVAGAGNETLTAGTTVLNVSGVSNVAESSASDVFFGGAGTATMIGGSGNDTFIAGSGNAVMTGDGGANLYFVFAGATTTRTDIITDFSATAGDRLAFGGAHFTAAASGGNTLLTLSDGTKITLDGVTNFSASTMVI